MGLGDWSSRPVLGFLATYLPCWLLGPVLEDTEEEGPVPALWKCRTWKDEPLSDQWHGVSGVPRSLVLCTSRTFLARLPAWGPPIPAGPPRPPSTPAAPAPAPSRPSPLTPGPRCALLSTRKPFFQQCRGRFPEALPFLSSLRTCISSTNTDGSLLRGRASMKQNVGPTCTKPHQVP